MYPVIHKERIEREREITLFSSSFLQLGEPLLSGEMGYARKKKEFAWFAAALALRRRKTKSLTRIDEQF
jgi:hypothetical protein